MTSSGAERRLDRRLDTDLPITVLDGDPAPGRLVNISRGGAALHIDRRPATKISDELSFRVEAGPSIGLVLTGKLLAITARGDDAQHLLHLKFVRLSRGDERALAALMDAIAPRELRASSLLPSLRGSDLDVFDEQQLDAFFVALRGPGKR